MEKYKHLLLVYFCTLVCLGLLAYFGNVYPSGYNFTERASNFEVKKGIIAPQITKVHITKDNTLQVDLIKAYINRLVNHWLFYSFFLSFFIAGLLGFFNPRFRFNLNLNTYVVIYTTLFIVVVIVGLAIFSNEIKQIDSLVKMI